MKAFKRCYWRYLGRHEFKIISKTVRLHVIPDSHMYERKCVRCGLHQKISTTLGPHFLEKETGGK